MKSKHIFCAADMLLYYIVREKLPQQILPNV